MKIALYVLMLSLTGYVSGARAHELDNESEVKNRQRISRDLPQTLVVRKDHQGHVSVMHARGHIAKGPQQFDPKAFRQVANSKPPRELDRDSSSSGWYFWWNTGYTQSYPTYYYYGYSYGYTSYYYYYNPYDQCQYYYYGYNPQIYGGPGYGY
ncbi:MAG: hypothetical protein ACXVBE_13045 [Bdellovibrionota bacterium]